MNSVIKLDRTDGLCLNMLRPHWSLSYIRAHLCQSKYFHWTDGRCSEKRSSLIDAGETKGIGIHCGDMTSKVDGLIICDGHSILLVLSLARHLSLGTGKNNLSGGRARTFEVLKEGEISGTRHGH